MISSPKALKTLPRVQDAFLKKTCASLKRGRLRTVWVVCPWTSYQNNHYNNDEVLFLGAYRERKSQSVTFAVQWGSSLAVPCLSESLCIAVTKSRGTAAPLFSGYRTAKPVVPP